MTPREWIVYVLKKYPRKGWHRLVWRWAPVKSIRRYYALKNFAWRKHLKAKRAGRPRKAAKWLERHKVAKRKFFAAKAAESGHGYEVWMLNGDPSNIDPALEEVIGFAVLECGLTVTDTYGYSGHTSSSFHYPWNDPSSPHQGRAVDLGGDGMKEAQTKLFAEFPDLAELFGPQDWFVKYGSKYPVPGGGAFPGHDDHIHAARPRG